MKFNVNRKAGSGTGNPSGNSAGKAFAGASLLVAGLAMVPAAQGGDCARKNGIETVTICDSTITVRNGDVVAKREFHYNQPASICWKVAGIDSSGVKLAYELNAVFDTTLMMQVDTATVAYGRDTTISSRGRDSLRIRVDKGPDANSASATAAFPK